MGGKNRSRPGRLIHGSEEIAAQPLAGLRKGQEGLSATKQTQLRARGWIRSRAHGGAAPSCHDGFYYILAAIFNFKPPGFAAPDAAGKSIWKFGGMASGPVNAPGGSCGVLHLVPIPPGSILRRWKRNWFVLYLDGSLVYYHDETQRDMDGRIHVKYSCRDVRAGRECRGERSPKPPKLRSTCAFAHLGHPKIKPGCTSHPFPSPNQPERCTLRLPQLFPAEGETLLPLCACSKHEPTGLTHRSPSRTNKENKAAAPLSPRAPHQAPFSGAAAAAGAQTQRFLLTGGSR